MPYAQTAREGAPAPIRPLRILLVEDDAIISTLIAEVLVSLGHTVVAIEATEADAIAAARREAPEMMILDDKLSVGSGVAAMREILLTTFIPHIFIGGDAGSIKAQAPNAIVVEKPFHERQLVQAMQRALDSSAGR